MWIFFYAGISGWLALILVGLTALLPYLLRRSRVSVLLDMVPATGRAYLARMWPHFWLGYAATAISFAHAWIFMSRAPTERVNKLGLNLASVALLWFLLQIAIGLLLQQRDLRERRTVRKWHFWSMVGILALVGAHVWLNG
jgi:hypothetical protein